MPPRIETIGTLPDGAPLQAWHLGADGLRLVVLNWGARVASLSLPVGGARREITLTLPDAAAWLADRAHLGAVAGRYANRIANARFTLDGREVRLIANNGPNTLHGGPQGFGRLPWQAEADGEAVVFRLDSPDGDQGFPGRLRASLRYAVAGDEVSLRYAAETDAPTVLNLTSHTYFNLNGGGDVLGHEVMLPAERFLAIGAGMIPTGERRPVAGTPLDFRRPCTIGARIETDDEQLRQAGGYDHCFVLAEAPRAVPELAGRVAAGGVVLEVRTTEPGVQLYSGNSLSGTYAKRTGLCLETQHFPDSPNHADFPSTVLRPGMTFRSETVWRIGAAEAR